MSLDFESFTDPNLAVTEIKEVTFSSWGTFILKIVSKQAPIMKSPLIFSFLLLFGCPLFSQSEVPVVPNKSEESLKKPEPSVTPQKAEALYFCPKCGYSSTKPGICPIDKSTLVKEGGYICPDCKKPGDKPGDCPKCGKPLKKKSPSDDGKSIPLKNSN